MAVKDFGSFIERARKEFRSLLDMGCSFENVFKEMFKTKLDECSSIYEEDCLKENLQEEFADYMDGIKKGV